MNASPILDLTDVTVPSRRDNEQPEIEHVTWNVQPGEFWVIGGSHGKNDLIFMLAGLTRPLQGRYLLFGQDMAQRFGDEFLPNRLRTAMVFDDARLFSSRTIAENVALPIRYHQNLTAEESAGWVAALLKETGIGDLAGQTASAITRQWKRRAALARALALRPELLFVENALRGLDARHAAWWIDFVAKLQRGHAIMAGKPMTIVVSTDDYWPWRKTAARYASTEGGTLQVTGDVPPRDDPFAHPFAQMDETAGDSASAQDEER